MSQPMRIHTSIARPVAALSFAAALLAACSSGSVIDSNHLEQVVEDGLTTNGITATVTCPDNVPIQQGGTFDCQAVTPDGISLTILITMTDSAGTVNWQVVGS